MTKAAKAERAVEDEVPHTWLDPLLTGPSAVIGNPPYTCEDIERLLNAVKERVRQASKSKRKRG
jgi:hypothetical protein